jgi:hypothetical protein
MSESMLPAESTWDNLSAEELRKHLAALKQSSNHVLLKVQELERDNKRLQKDLASRTQELEEVMRGHDRLTDRIRALDVEKRNILGFLTAYRIFVEAKNWDALLKLEHALWFLERSAFWVEGGLPKALDEVMALLSSVVGDTKDTTMDEQRARPKKGSKPAKKSGKKTKPAAIVEIRGKRGVARAPKGVDLRDVLKG